MAAISTQAALDVLKNEYFILEDGTDWPTATLSTATASPVKPRIASLSQKLQDDLIDMIDGMDPLVA